MRESGFVEAWKIPLLWVWSVPPLAAQSRGKALIAWQVN